MPCQMSFPLHTLPFALFNKCSVLLPGLAVQDSVGQDFPLLSNLRGLVPLSRCQIFLLGKDFLL